MSEDKNKDAMLSFFDALEAGIVKARQELGAETTKPHKEIETWDSTKITWVDAEGTKGPYKKSDDVNSLEFKKMLKILSDHEGRINHKEADGSTWFYWTFENGKTVGRKLKKPAAAQ